MFIWNVKFQNVKKRILQHGGLKCNEFKVPKRSYIDNNKNNQLLFFLTILSPYAHIHEMGYDYSDRFLPIFTLAVNKL